jgi:hypothetical protein
VRFSKGRFNQFLSPERKKTIHLEDYRKESMRGTGLGYALYSEIIKQGQKTKCVE